VTVDQTPTVRHIADPPGIGVASTLPASWYADQAFFEHERRAVFAPSWVAAGITDELPAPGQWTARTVGGVPVLLVRDRDGVLRAFLNVCRHRAAPLCEDGALGEGARIRCPYHSWLYRLDGTLARASGVGEPDGFDVDDYPLTEVTVTTWRRVVFVRVGSRDGRAADPLDLGSLGEASRTYDLEGMRLHHAETDERPFNWKVLLENYSENYHTPFVHPEIDTSSSEDYPMVSDGLVLYAWDRVLHPSTDDERVRAALLPGEPGWEALGAAGTDRPYDVGSYLTVWPNLMVNLFPDAALVMWMEPLSATRTRVQRRLFVAADMSPERGESIVAAHRLVHDQDVDICSRVQRSHNAGLDANGVLATVEERGVFFVHEHLCAAMRDGTG
jgi:phenylpropionate dioxygenase-like ring-hydroxylating dioxygenase large terminal subunit